MREKITEKVKVVKKQEKITTYVAEDGTEFQNKDACICHELKPKWDNWIEKFNVKEIESENSSTDTIIFKYHKEYDSEIREFLKAFSRYYKYDKDGKIYSRYLTNITTRDLENAENEINKKEFIDKEIYKFNVYYDEGDVDYDYGTYEVEFLDWEEELAKIQERIQKLEKIFEKKFIFKILRIWKK